MIITVLKVEPDAVFDNGQQGIALSASLTHGLSDNAEAVAAVRGFMDRWQESLKTALAQSPNGLHVEEFYFPQDTVEPSIPLSPEFAKALVAADQQFIGIQQLVLYSPKDVAKAHIAVVLRDYAAPLRRTIQQCGDSAAQVLATLQQELGRGDEDEGRVHLKMDTETYKEMTGILEMIIAADLRQPE